MEKRTAVAVIATSILVAGCMTMQGIGPMRPGPQKAMECKGSVACEITVKVSNGSTMPDPDFVIVNSTRNTPVILQFKPDSGVTIESVDFGDTGGEIETCMKDGASGQWKCKDLHRTFGVFKYSVKAKDAAAADPWIVND